MKNNKYNCDGCGKEIVGIKAYTIISHKKTGQTKRGYCSTSCRKKNKSKRISINCGFCNKSVEIWGRFKKDKNFCSHSCSAKFLNRKRHGAPKTCFTCGNKTKSLSENCKSCHGKLNRENIIRSWKKDSSTGTDKFYVLKKQIREYIFNKYDNKCCKCGWSEIHPVTKKIPLQVDHIDGNHKNNKEKNLRLLCPNCHALTPNYGSLNWGNGREHKRVYNREYKQKN